MNFLFFDSTNDKKDIEDEEGVKKLGVETQFTLLRTYKYGKSDMIANPISS